MDPMIGTWDAARNPRRRPVVIFHTVLNLTGKRLRLHVLSVNVKVRHNTGNLVMQLVSE